jgi:hypothetical protein
VHEVSESLTVDSIVATYEALLKHVVGGRASRESVGLAVSEGRDAMREGRTDELCPQAQSVARGAVLFVGIGTAGVETGAIRSSQDGNRVGGRVTQRRGVPIEVTNVLRELGEGRVLGERVRISGGCFLGAKGGIETGCDTIRGSPEALVR